MTWLDGRPRTVLEKIWNRHVVASEGDMDLLYVDRCYLDETSHHAFSMMAAGGHEVRSPSQIFTFADHYVPTAQRELGIRDAGMREMVELVRANSIRHRVTHVGMDDPRHGIMHVVAPEQGISQPGLVIVGGDSHTSTHGALGALAFGIGTSECAHVLATQTLWQRRPKTMRILVDGALAEFVVAKDVILAIIAQIGVGGGTGHLIEYAGSAIRRLPMEARMTICNMSIEAGARAGLVAPDEITFRYLRGRPYSPDGPAWTGALEKWTELASDPNAPFDREIRLDAAAIVPMVTWGTNPEHAAAVTGRVPDPSEQGGEKRAEVAAALAYMGLEPGMPITEIRIDKVFIGSCTNARIDDLRAAAAVVRGRRAVVPAWVVPGSSTVKRQAEAEGLDRVFRDAGFDWRDSGCSLCTAVNGDTLKPGERCASTSNRNFQGRQGVGGRTHLLSPPMAAAAALEGRIADVRKIGGRG